jgi:PAS domain S-box-containing protein
MVKKRSPADVTDDLRVWAAKVLADGGTDRGPKLPDNVRQLVHKLLAHQMELETQNEELRRAQETITETRSRYVDLYDLASVGYVTLDPQGLIVDLNLKSSRLLGMPRNSLIQRPFILLIAPQDRQTFHAYLGQLSAGADNQSCELRLNSPSAPGTVVFLESLGMVEAGVKVTQYRLALSDVTRRRQAEEVLRATQAPVWLRPDYIFSPEGDISEEELSSILDTEAMESLLEDVTKLTGLALAIIDIKGKVLVATGWQDICTQFHRVHPQAAQNCTESDLFLSRNLRPGEYVAYRCKNHLWDVATPLFIGRKHVGNVYTGQFFYDDETIEDQLFIDRAAEYGFDRERYLTALHQVPRISRDRVKPLMDFLTKFSSLISKLSFSNLNLARMMFEQQRIEASLRQSEEHFRRLIKLSPVPVLIIDQQGDIEYLNDRFLTTFGYTLEDIPDLEAWWQCAYPGEAQRLKGMANWRQAVEKTAQEHTDIEPSESPVTCKDGTVRIAEIFGSKIGNKNLVILQDITERKQAEEEIARRRDQLRALAARLAEVEEAERHHLARELHDQVCQSLTALGLTLTLLQVQMPRKASSALLTRLADAVALVEQTGLIIRDLMSELRPPMLDDYGLLSALHWYGEKFFGMTGITVEVQGQEAAPRLAAPVELALFRIMQEAMNNVAKHAQASEVVLTEEVDDHTLRLVIADNGVGFDQELVGQPEGRHLWGLMTMSERAGAVGGHCHISSHPGEGTRVVVEVGR